MALLAVASNWLILLPPKVGSRWVAATLTKAGVQVRKVAGTHAGLADVPGRYAGVATFVRHPVDWHASYWAYRNSERSAWDPRWDLDARCASASWETYIRLAVTRCPGHVTRMFEGFAGSRQSPVEFIGRQENLRQDVVRLLKAIGENFDEAVMETLPAINASELRPKITPQERELVWRSDEATYDRFGYMP